MFKQLAIPALVTAGLLATFAAPVASAKDHGRHWNQGEDRGESRNYDNRGYDRGYGNYGGEHDSRDFGHSRGRGHGQSFGYQEHDRRAFGHSRGRGRALGRDRYQQNSYYYQRNSRTPADLFGRLLGSWNR